VNVCR